jgi:hypothetical protein
MRDGFRVAIHQQQLAIGIQTPKDCARMTAAPEGAIEVATAGAHRQSGEHGFPHHRDVLKLPIGRHRSRSVHSPYPRTPRAPPASHPQHPARRRPPFAECVCHNLSPAISSLTSSSPIV